MATRSLTFSDARQLICVMAQKKGQSFRQEGDVVTLEHSVGRVAKEDLRSPQMTPAFDTATLEGYAVISQQTRQASEMAPVQLRVLGVMHPGDPPLEVDERVLDGLVPCVKLHVGAAYPIAQKSRQQFDGCIPIQHASVVRHIGEDLILQAITPPLTSWHKRIHGSDFREGDLILEKGAIVAPKHVMALATSGLKSATVLKTVRAGVISVGSELLTTMLPNVQSNTSYKTPDANGPYLAAALREMGVEGHYLGAMSSDSQMLSSWIRQTIDQANYDIFIVIEGVLSGRMDTTQRAVESLGGDVHFNHVFMSPGSNVVFATLPAAEGPQIHNSFHGRESSPSGRFYTPPKTPATPRKNEPVIFGLPGAPIASAACFRFLVTPYIKALTNMSEERALYAKVAVTPETAYAHPTAGQFVIEGSAQYDVFRHGILRSNDTGVTVEVSRDRSVSKANPFASSNCWVHLPRGHVGKCGGDVATIFPFCSPKS